MAKTLNAEQKELAKAWFNSTCFELVGCSGTGECSPAEFVRKWKNSVAWLRRVADDMDQHIDGYATAQEVFDF